MIGGIVVGFVRGNGPLSRVIGWFGAGYYSHVTTLWCERTNVVIDARLDRIYGVPPGVQMRPLHYLKGDRVDWLRLPASASRVSQCKEALYSQVGKPYDTLGIWNFVSGKMRDRNFRDCRAWFCDELAVWSWEQADIIPPLALAPSRITPGGAALVASAIGAVSESVSVP